MADQTKGKIEEILNSCLCNLPACQNLQELTVPVEIMIRQVAALIRPDYNVEFTPLKKDPQDNHSSEENKEEASPDVTFWMEKLSIAIKKRAQEVLVQISDMLDNRIAMTKSLNRMQIFNIHSSQLQKQTIEAISQEINELQNEESQHLDLKVNIAKDIVEKIKSTIEQIQKNSIKLNLKTRYNAPYMPIVKVQNNECPPINAQSFENYLVAVQNCGTNDCNFNFIFKRGDTSNFKPSKPLKEIKIEPEGTEVKRAVVWYNPKNAALTYIELFDKDGRKLLEAGDTLQNRQRFKNKSHEIILEEGERIIGFKSRKNSDIKATHSDFQLLLGKLT